MPVNVEVLRTKVRQDKELAAQVLAEARKELGEFSIELPVREDITGAGMAANREQQRFKLDQHAALSAVQRELYHQRVDTASNGDLDDRTSFLFTAYRIQAPILGDGWTVLPWTNPLAALFRGKKPGEEGVVHPNNRPALRHLVLESAQFGTILPQVLRADYRLPEGDAYVADETVLDPAPVTVPAVATPAAVTVVEAPALAEGPVVDEAPATPGSTDAAGEVPSLDAPPEGLEALVSRDILSPGAAAGGTEVFAPESRPEEGYEATGVFGLGEIIELADTSQYQAMQLPFGETVLIEGPPGSGKTSIGLMRIPCLLDQQWEELGLDQKKDLPYHTKGSIRVLVINEEMIEYLQRLIRNPKIGLDAVPVQTLTDFCRSICRDTGVLGGRPVQESPALTALKLHPLAIRAYAAAFQVQVRRYWEAERDAWQESMAALNPELAARAADAIGRWVGSLLKLGAPNLVWEGAPNLASALHSLFGAEQRKLGTVTAPARGGMTLMEQRRYESERKEWEAATQRLREFSEQTAAFAKGFFDRQKIVAAMMETPEFDALLRGFSDERRVSKSDLREEWASQAQGDVQRLSAGDFALTAWLAAHVAAVPGSGAKPAFGGYAPWLTHAVIDEAQDIALVHVALLRRLMPVEGTMTLVGDLRQRVSNRGHFASWADFGLPKIAHAVFGVNYRQSQPLGEFVRALHQRLFGELPVWKASSRTLGEKPRVRRLRGVRGLAEAVAAEIRHWRESIPNSTVAVLHHGKWNGAAKLRDALEGLLQDTLTDVHLAKGAGRNDALRRTDCAMVATVAGTKGLEFDAVIVIDPNEVWAGGPRRMAATKKNAIYVAASRAKQGLSMVLHSDTRWHLSGDLRKLMKIVSDPKGE